MALLDRAHGRRLHVGRRAAFYGPYGDIKDVEGCETQFRSAFLLGCVGAWSLHPAQIDIAKKVFSPDPEEVLFAKRVIEAIPDGAGVHMIDGKMQDDATWKQSKVMVDLAEMLAAEGPGARRGLWPGACAGLRPATSPRCWRFVEAGFEGYRAFGHAGWEPPPENTPERVERTRAELADPATFSLVAEEDGQIAGFCHWVAPDDPYDVRFRYLFIGEPWWGTGLARELHGLAMEALGDRTARLYTPREQARARRFYGAGGLATDRDRRSQRFRVAPGRVHPIDLAGMRALRLGLIVVLLALPASAQAVVRPNGDIAFTQEVDGRTRSSSSTGRHRPAGDHRPRAGRRRLSAPGLREPALVVAERHAAARQRRQRRLDDPRPRRAGTGDASGLARPPVPAVVTGRDADRGRGGLRCIDSPRGRLR